MNITGTNLVIITHLFVKWNSFLKKICEKWKFFCLIFSRYHQHGSPAPNLPKKPKARSVHSLPLQLFIKPSIVKQSRDPYDEARARVMHESARRGIEHTQNRIMNLLPNSLSDNSLYPNGWKINTPFKRNIQYRTNRQICSENDYAIGESGRALNNGENENTKRADTAYLLFFVKSGQKRYFCHF